MVSGFPLYRKTMLEVSKKYSSVIVSNHKRYEMLPSLLTSILHHDILPLSIIQKISSSELWTSWHPAYNLFFCSPLFTWPNYVSNIFGVGRGTQIYTNWTSNEVENWGWFCKKWKENSFFLLIMRVRLLQKIGLLDLMNLTQLKKGNG